VEIARFLTENGLEYCGMRCTEKLLGNQIFIEVPRQMLLTTKLAFFSDI